MSYQLHWQDGAGRQAHKASFSVRIPSWLREGERRGVLLYRLLL